MASATSLHATGSPSGTGGRWSPRLWGLLVVVCGALFLDALDVSMVGVALPSIRADLGLSTASLQWVVSGYVLGYGGLLLLGGRAADLLGRRRVFLAALAVFAVASLLGGLVSSGALLIAARFVKGVAAAFTAPAGLSIITTTFSEGPARNRALSVYSAFGAAGFSLGLVLSGLVTEVSWRWTLMLPAPVAAVILLAATRLIPPGGRADRGGRRFDLPGAVAVTSGMLLLVYAVVGAPQAGWGSARTLISFAVAAALLGAFAAIERRSRDPLVRLGIFRSRTLTRANIGAMVLFGSYVSFQFLVTQYLQIMAGWSALATALAFLPAGVLVAAASPRVGPVLDRFGPARVVTAGFACLVAGYVLFLRVGPVPDYPTVILPSLLLIGAAFGLGFSSLNVQATAGVADHEQGLASGILQTSFQVGGAMVLAAVTAVIDARGANEVVSAHMLAVYRPALYVITGVAVAGLAVALTGLRSPRPHAASRVSAGDRGEAELEPVRS
ncbi:MAG TPA: MFS transporter [Streptosporangiaceae bacterium]|nr:MFS transporter [Streptosporangiaceae bacterium]